MSLSKQIIIAVLLILLTTTTFAKKSKLAKLPPLQEGKARLFWGMSPHNIDFIATGKHVLGPLNIGRAYTDGFGYFGHSFYVMNFLDNTFNPLVKVMGNRSDFLEKEMLYMDIDPSKLKLYIYARQHTNFGILRDLPVTYDIDIKANEIYQIVVGYGRREFQRFPPLEVASHQLSKKQLEFCNMLRTNHRRKRKEIDEIHERAIQLGISTRLQNYSCFMVAHAKPYQMKVKTRNKINKYVEKKKEKLLENLEKRKQHEINVANGDPSGKKTIRKAIEDAKKRKKQEKAERWKKIREEKAKQKQE